tara:strand:+ start:115 stop:795 length:681 start_codon:yes stop_codon:yes gene_type:complete
MEVLLLCGGKGTRLHPLTKTIPKPLVKIKDQTIIDYIIKHLHNSGLNKFLICSGYKSEMIENHINNYKIINAKIINSGKVDILQRILDCKNMINDKFMVCYGDTIANINIEKLNKFHKSHSGIATICSYQLKQNFGIIKNNNNKQVISFIEKPEYKDNINIGYFVFDIDVFDHIQFAKNWLDLIRILIEKKQLFSFEHDGVHITINTLDELASAEKSIELYLDTIK